jgi:hypothetical protein
MGENENDYKGYEKHRRAYRKSDPPNYSVVVRHHGQSLEPPTGDGPLTNGVLGTDLVTSLTRLSMKHRTLSKGHPRMQIPHLLAVCSHRKPRLQLRNTAESNADNNMFDKSYRTPFSGQLRGAVSSDRLVLMYKAKG